MDKVIAPALVTKPQVSPQASAQSDDPLLLALLSICKLLHTPHSADALTAGLPLVDNKLTLPLFIRAAERAGLSAGYVKRPLHKISNLVLPAVLLLHDDKTCILLKKENGLCTLLLPETGSGEKTLAEDDLAAEYGGGALFIQLTHQFDERTSDSITPKIKHWFWDVI